MPTFYVASTSHPTTPGNDSTGTGTTLLPWATISKAHTSAASGDTIIVKAATGSIAWATQSFTKVLTIQGESVPAFSDGAWTGAILNGAAATVQWSIDAAASVTLNNLIFRNASCISNQQPILKLSTASAAISCTRCVFTLLTLLSFSGQGGIYRPISNNTTHTFNTCIFYSNTYPSDSIFNVFSTTGCVAFFYNTIVYGANQCFGNQNTLASHTITAQNCIFQALSATLFINVASTWTSFAYNTTVNYTSVPSGSNNLTTDPLFVAPTSGDFRLRPGSPAINVGVVV